jgi:peptide/nickel transport system ATP-binding protein
VSGAPLLELRATTKRFVRRLDAVARTANFFGAGFREAAVRAVDGVDLAIHPEEVVGLVGESGCGKSTLGRLAAGLLAPDSGTRLWRGREIAAPLEGEGEQARIAIQMIFQDPHAALSPRMQVRDIVGEAPVAHGMVPRSNAERYLTALLARVGLEPGVARLYPHQLSGGQRARVGIARALAVRPELLVCDEALTALDVSLQAQVLNLFIELRATLGLAYLFISHDLAVVRHIADRVAVMYLGRIVESAPTEALYASPNHPYTAALLAEAPRLDVRHRAFAPVRGEVPSPLAPPSGCHFHPRCPHAMPRCRIDIPALREIAPGRQAACHLNDGAANDAGTTVAVAANAAGLHPNPPHATAEAARSDGSNADRQD